MLTKPKRTPGPWTIPTPSMGFSAIHGPNGELIFGLAAGSAEEKRPDDVCDANARLIAAAPELYEAAARALEEMCRTTAPRTSFTDAVDALDAALSKARGEPC